MQAKCRLGVERERVRKRESEKERERDGEKMPRMLPSWRHLAMFTKNRRAYFEWRFSILTGLGGILHELVQAVGEERVEVAHEYHRSGQALGAGLPHVVEAICEGDLVLQGDLSHTHTHTHTHTHESEIRCTKGSRHLGIRSCVFSLLQADVFSLVNRIARTRLMKKHTQTHTPPQAKRSWCVDAPNQLSRKHTMTHGLRGKEKTRCVGCTAGDGG